MNESRIMDGPINDGNLGGPIGNDGPTMDELRENRELVGATYSPRTVTIEPMHHGYVVKLDCHRFAFETHERVLECVGEYLKDPSATEEKWWKKELFK
jgi:hypothetical protein